MHVWAQRKRTDESAAALPARRAGVADAWALRVLGGVHAGAERKLQDSNLLMIGSSDDCDIIFSDPEVAAHHCLVSRNGESLSIRAVDAEVRIDERILHPGEPQDITPFSLIRLGGTCFAMGPHWSDRWQTLLARIDPGTALVAEGEQTPVRVRSGNRALTLAVAAVLLIAGTGALVLAQNGTKPPPPPAAAPVRDAELRTLIGTLGDKGLDVTAQKDGRLLVTGYVEKDEDLDALNALLQQRGFNATVEAKSGPRIADDVAETFRLRNLRAKTEWKGEGHVFVSGRLGDDKDLKEFLASRTVRELNEKLHLTLDLNNLDRQAPEPVAVPPGKRIVRVVDGIDPYVVTADASRIYVNGRLPQGGVFLGLDNGEVLVRDDADNIRRLPRESLVDASSSQ